MKKRGVNVREIGGNVKCPCLCSIFIFNADRVRCIKDRYGTDMSTE